MKYFENLSYKRSLILAFLLSFMPKAILCFCVEPIAIISDEVAAVAGGAYWAGLDWSDVVSHAGYYGTGMTAFTAVFFKLTDDPKILYTLITLFCTVWQSVPASIAYAILHKYFNIKKNVFNIIVAVACAYFVTPATIVVFNEHGIILLSWIVALLLLKLNDTVCSNDKKKRILYTVILMLVISYALTLHTRMILFWIGLAVTVIFYGWTYRKCLISIPAAVMAGIPGYVLAKFYITYMQNALWLANQRTNDTPIRNAEIGGVLPALRQLLSPQSWQAWVNIILGQFHTIAIFSGGLFIVLIIVFIHFILKKVLRKNLDDTKQDIEQKMFPLIVFFAFCIAATMAGQSLTWLWGSIDVIKLGFDNNLYASKAYGYLRYFLPYCGPIVLAGAVYLNYWKKKIFNYRISVIVTFMFLEFYWMVCIVPYLYRTTHVGALEFYFPFSLQALTDPIGLRTIIPATIVMFIAIILGIIFVNRDKISRVFLITSALCIYSYFYIGISWSLVFVEQNKVLAQNSYELIDSVKDEVEIPYEIYVEDSWKKEDHNNFYMYQILLNRHKIIAHAPEDTIEECVFFTNDTYTEDYYRKYTDQGYMYYKVGEYELLLVKGENLQKQFIEAGVALN